MSRQASILSFAVEKPRYVAPHRPSLPVKRIPKRRPGRPRKKVRVGNWREQWYKAVENEQWQRRQICPQGYEVLFHHSAFAQSVVTTLAGSAW